MKSKYAAKAGFLLLFCHCHVVAASAFYCPGILSLKPLVEMRSLKELPDEIDKRIRKALRYDAPKRESLDPFRAMLNDSFPLASPEREIADRDEKLSPSDIQKIPGRHFLVAGLNENCAIVGIQDGAPYHIIEIYLFEHNHVQWHLLGETDVEEEYPPKTLEKLFEYLKDR